MVVARVMGWKYIFVPHLAVFDHPEHAAVLLFHKVPTPREVVHDAFGKAENLMGLPNGSIEHVKAGSI